MVKPLMFVPLAVVVGLLAASYVKLGTGDQSLPSTMQGRSAPVVTVTALGSGSLITQDDLKAPGVKLVNFWASWCQPCRAEHPMLETMQADGVVIYGINYKDKPDVALGLLAELGNPYAKISADQGRMALDWGVYGVPETYVIDSKGVVVLRWAGPITETVLEQNIRPAMARAAAQ
jgi:cytochrome c biogenesis protein CcmG, thiol:disulfide interchange protein DsbE